METKLFSTAKSDIAEAGRILADGGLVAFPTETVYGLGANALNEQAVKKAKEYLDYSSFSRSGLISQLKYEGFTTEQAEYGVTQNGL